MGDGGQTGYHKGVLKHRLFHYSIHEGGKPIKRGKLPTFHWSVNLMSELLITQKMVQSALKRAIKKNENTDGNSVAAELLLKWDEHENRWHLMLYYLLKNLNLLTGSIRTVPGGPGRPSAPGRPERPVGPFNKNTHLFSVSLKISKAALMIEDISTHPFSSISRAAWWTRNTWGSRETLF